MYLFIFKSQAVSNDFQMNWTHLLVHNFRHPKEGHFNSHRVKPPLSAQRIHQMNEWVAHTSQHLFLGSNVKQRGNIKRSALGECSLRKGHTRVETANEGRFSSQICSERVDRGVN